MRVWWIPALLAVALAAAVLDQDAGIRAWLGLRRDVAASEERLQALRAEIEARRQEARALESDPAAQERAIREELGWARPGELVVKLPPAQNSSISLTK
jgi:cell division protein FtsB